MIRRILCTTFALVAATAVAVQADPKDDVTAGVQKLADAANYSWTTTRTTARGTNTQTGKTEKDGYTSLSLTFGDNTTEILMKGGKVAIKGDSGWQTPDEIAAADQANGGGGGGFNPATMMARMAQTFKSPADTLKGDVDTYQNIQKTDDGYTADMTDDQIKQAMTFGGRRGGGGGGGGAAAGANGGGAPPEMTVTNGKGTVKIWITDGAVSKYEVHVTGTVSFNGNDRDVDNTTTTEISAVGSTTVDVPDDAKAKLNG